MEAWLRLLRAPGVGPVSFARLLQVFGEPEAVLAASADRLREAGLKPAALDWLRNPDRALLEKDMQWVSAPGHQLLSIRDEAYPTLLRDVPDPPPLLFVNGDAALLSLPQLAIVGSRNPTQGGGRNAFEFARFLASAGLIPTSGLATGIDASAHQGALQTGTTIAVAGTGPDRIYPAANRDLARQIAVQGAIVTELPPGTAPRREHFPRRNRIISGLSLGVLVVEAAARSGSLITARLAAEQGREVFALPGSIHNPLAKGCHQLIRNGAKLVDSADDIIEELHGLLGVLSAAPGQQYESEGAVPELDAEYIRLLKCLSHDPVTQDALLQCSGFSSDVVSSMLLLLELEGLVETLPGGRYVRTLSAEPLLAGDG